MITYEGIGYWAFLLGPAALFVLLLLPRHSRAAQLLRKTVLASLLIIAAIVALSY
ncbi:hypothetical protein OG530_19210 [Streptomyces decoyicus]|uniref:hypothetical protein n=1 Tax=Streptomyces decoyicus TaxID=249567 RepID=UPI002E19F7B0